MSSSKIDLLDRVILQLGAHLEGIQKDVRGLIPAYTAQRRTADAVKSTLKRLIALRAACRYSETSGQIVAFEVPAAWRTSERLLDIAEFAAKRFKKLKLTDSKGLDLRPVEHIEFVNSYKAEVDADVNVSKLAA